jgi:D-hydroxyproline dehydrogenase subunit beta
VTRADVVVVGAGIVGVSTAWELQRRGATVTLVDRAGVSEGTTGVGEGNVLAGDKEAGPELELTRLGLEVYADIEARLGEVARIRRKGALVVHPDERTWAAEPARVAALNAAGVQARLVDREEALELEPRLTGDLLGATFVPGDLQCDPRAITRALAAELGDRVRTGAEVEALTGDGVRLRSGEELRAEATVLAAGAWSAPLARGAGLELPVEPRKGQLARLRVPEPDPGLLRRKVLDGSYMLSVLSGGTARQVSTVVETTWDGHVVVGSSRERSGFDPAVDAGLSAELQRRAAALVPALAQLELDDAWVGFRPWLPDNLPAIGPSRRVPGLWVGTGHEGAGVALGPVTGRVLAELMTGGAAPLDLAPFDPDRFG